MNAPPMFKKSAAVRENVKLKIGMTGPSGAGKTYSALQLAYGITGDWKKIAVVDTENRSALYYAELGDERWQHIAFDPDEIEGGYHPNNWVSVIKFAEKDPSVEVLILDSISHEWEGRGGCLDLIDKIGKGGNSFTPWKTVTPLHAHFLDAMRLSPLHIIATMRTKQDYVLEANEKGKMVPKKVGLKSIQREGADYEFGIVFELAMNHHATASKDRTGVFMPRGEFQVTPAIGRELLAWSNSAPSPFDGRNPNDQGWLWNELKSRNFTAGKEGAMRVLQAMTGRPRDDLDSVLEQTSKEISAP